ncbi:hypothetical protein D3C77_689700 [compost metagenome]
MQSFAKVEGLQDTYTKRFGFVRSTASMKRGSSPVRGGSAMMTSGLKPDFTQRESSSSALPSWKKALPRPLRAAFALASSTASGIDSMPRTSLA